MPKAKYEEIYRDLKEKIEEGSFPYSKLLPTESILVQNYSCSRNTLRRAVALLVQEGYLQSMQGKGVRSIYQRVNRRSFLLDTIETFKESSERNDVPSATQVILFTELSCSESLSTRTGFSPGEELYYIQRLHYMDNRALILNHNYFLKSAAAGLTKEIAAGSIYEYLEKNLGMNIINSKRVITVEKATQIDEKFLNLDTNEYNCLAVVSSSTYNSEGVMFEYTISRHRPDYFCFYDNALRKNKSEQYTFQ